MTVDEDAVTRKGLRTDAHALRVRAGRVVVPQVHRFSSWLLRRRFPAEIDAAVNLTSGEPSDDGGVNYLGSSLQFEPIGAGESRDEAFTIHDQANWLANNHAIKRLGLRADDVFVDIGAGQGLIVLLAARQRIKRVTGVEYFAEYAQAARRNVEHNRHRLKAGTVEVVTGDALEWEIPDDVTVAYLWSPFFGEVFGTFLDRLVEAHDRKPRRLRLIACMPWEHDQVVAHGRFQVVDVQPGQWPRRPFWWRRSIVVVTYAVVAPGERVAPTLRARLHPAFRRWTRPVGSRFPLLEAMAARENTDAGHPTDA